VLNHLPRPLAWLFALAFVALSVWCLTTTPPPIKIAKHGSYTDARLYHDIAAEVAKGRPYHQAAAELHRAHHYPLKPFVTMRPPTEMEIAARVGWKGVQAICFVLLVAAIFNWAILFENELLLVERIGVGFAVAVAGTIISSDWLLACRNIRQGFASRWPSR
jgi:hypothetical protein